MNYFYYLLLVGQLVLGRSLSVVRGSDGKTCRVASDQNHGCSGYSAGFANLKGDDCTNLIGVRPDEKSVKVDICGTEDGKQVAWVTINRSGTVSFLNREGETASCLLDNGIKVGSTCSIKSTSPQAHTSNPTDNQSSYTIADTRSTFDTMTTDRASTSTVAQASETTQPPTTGSVTELTVDVTKSAPTHTSFPVCTCSCTPVIS